MEIYIYRSNTSGQIFITTHAYGPHFTPHDPNAGGDRFTMMGSYFQVINNNIDLYIIPESSSVIDVPAPQRHQEL